MDWVQAKVKNHVFNRRSMIIFILLIVLIQYSNCAKGNYEKAIQPEANKVTFSMISKALDPIFQRYTVFYSPTYLDN